MSKRLFWISFRQLKAHEFRKTLRYLHVEGHGWPEIYLRLGTIQEEAIKRALKLWSVLLVIYLSMVTFTDGNMVAINFSNVKASLPTSVVALAACLNFFVIVIHLQSTITMIGIRANYSTKLKLRGVSSQAFGLYNGQDEMALATPISLNFFFKERFHVHNFIAFIMMASYAMVLLPLIGMWVFLLQTQFQIFVDQTYISFDFLIALAGLFVLFTALVFLLFFNIPLPMEKNSNSIRWGLLSTLYPVGGHARVQLWLAEDDDD